MRKPSTRKKKAEAMGWSSPRLGDVGKKREEMANSETTCGDLEKKKGKKTPGCRTSTLRDLPGGMNWSARENGGLVKLGRMKEMDNPDGGAEKGEEAGWKGASRSTASEWRTVASRRKRGDLEGLQRRGIIGSFMCLNLKK